MKIYRLLSFACVALLVTPLIGQQTAPTSPVAQAQSSTLTKFDLDFPGGTPGELIKAIEKATGRPLNAIISTVDANRRVPALKMKGVDVQELFLALSNIDVERDRRASLGMAGVRMVLSSKQPASDESIWSLQVRGPDFGPSSSTAFFLLAPYLDSGLSVDDITTAIQTAWRMQGLSEPPKISFHKETKLLIAVGDQMGVATIQQVLSALWPTLKKPAEQDAKKP